MKEEEEEEEKAPEVFPPPAGRCLGVACGVRDTGVLLGNSFQTFLIQRAAWFDSGCMRLLDGNWTSGSSFTAGRYFHVLLVFAVTCLVSRPRSTIILAYVGDDFRTFLLRAPCIWQALSCMFRLEEYPKIGLFSETSS